MKTLVVCSGGLDSVTLAYKVAAERELCALMTFDYGQRHKKEIDCAAVCAKALGVPHHVVDISHVGALLGGSALTDNVTVPDGHYAEDTMKATIVPNRNAIMMSIAYGAVVAMGAQSVAAAVHAGDHYIYPDCRPEFIHSFDAMQKTALEGVADITLYTPFLHQSKTEIAAEAARFNVPIAQTWSCYKGGDIHCGRCGTCVERLEACHDAGAQDGTVYADPDYWREAVAAHKRRQQA